MLRDAKLASELAVKAKQEEGNSDARIFGCLAPLAESHRPDRFASLLSVEGKDFIVQSYNDLGLAVISGGAEGILLENMTCWAEAELALEGVKGLNVPIMISIEGALRNNNLEPQTHLASSIARKCIVAKANGINNIESFGFGCTEPEKILACLEEIKKTEGLPAEVGVSDSPLATLHYSHRANVF